MGPSQSHPPWGNEQCSHETQVGVSSTGRVAWTWRCGNHIFASLGRRGDLHFSFSSPPSSKTGLFLEAASSSIVRCAPPPFPRALHVLHYNTSGCWVPDASGVRGWIPDHRNARRPSPVLLPRTTFSGNTPSLRCFPREFSPWDLEIRERMNDWAELGPFFLTPKEESWGYNWLNRMKTTIVV